MKEHLADIRHKRDKAVAIHFSAENHSFKDLKFVILERCMTDSCYYRRARESFWMERLNTITPHGINRKSQFGILWPDFMFERDSTHDSSAMTSQETRRRETYTCKGAIESTGVTRQKWQCATSQGTVENSVHARYFEWWKQVTKCDCFTKFIFLKKACGRNVERANKYNNIYWPTKERLQSNLFIVL